MLALLFLFYWLGKSKPPQPSVLARHIIANANPKGLGLLQRTILQEPYVLNCNEITKMSQKKMGNNANRSQIAFFQVVEFLNFVQNWIRKNTESLAKKIDKHMGWTCRFPSFSDVFLQIFIRCFIWGFPKIEVPRENHLFLDRIFHEINNPASLGYPHDDRTPQLWKQIFFPWLIYIPFNRIYHLWNHLNLRMRPYQVLRSVFIFLLATKLLGRLQYVLRPES